MFGSTIRSAAMTLSLPDPDGPETTRRTGLRATIWARTFSFIDDAGQLDGRAPRARTARRARRSSRSGCAQRAATSLDRLLSQAHGARAPRLYRTECAGRRAPGTRAD